MVSLAEYHKEEVLSALSSASIACGLRHHQSWKEKTDLRACKPEHRENIITCCHSGHIRLRAAIALALDSQLINSEESKILFKLIRFSEERLYEYLDLVANDLQEAYTDQDKNKERKSVELLGAIFGEQQSYEVALKTQQERIGRPLILLREVLNQSLTCNLRTDDLVKFIHLAKEYNQLASDFEDQPEIIFNSLVL